MEILKKNLLTILSAIAILAMFLTFITFSVESDFADTSETLTGLQACEYSVFGYILILGPALLIAMNYIKPLEKYKGILSMAIPCVCLVMSIILYFLARAGYQNGAGAAAGMASAFGVEMDFNTSFGLGLILADISYVAMIVFGIKTQHDFSIGKLKFDGINLEGIKSKGAELMKNAQESVSQATQNISSSINSTSNSHGTSKKQIDDTLALIERLAKMKDDGILNEEEFADKKKKLLEEI